MCVCFVLSLCVPHNNHKVFLVESCTFAVLFSYFRCQILRETGVMFTVIQKCLFRKVQQSIRHKCWPKKTQQERLELAFFFLNKQINKNNKTHRCLPAFEVLLHYTFSQCLYKPKWDDILTSKPLEVIILDRPMSSFKISWSVYWTVIFLLRSRCCWASRELHWWEAPLFRNNVANNRVNDCDNGSMYL